MERRGFIKVMATGGCIALYPAIFSGCSASESLAAKKNQDFSDTDDIRLKLISYAMLAPNSHNIQPWKVYLKGPDSFELYVDQTRLLPETDPPARQIHISQGTFLEYFKIAASNEGYRTEIEYFPKGIYSNQVVENKPVAAVKLVKDPTISVDPLYEWLRVRQSNKRLYQDKPVPQTALDQLAGLSVNDGLQVKISSSRDLLEKLGPMLGKAMAIETEGSARNRETVDIFRFSEEEAEEKRDGFTLANNGVTGFTRFIAETFFLGTKQKAYATDSSFAKEGIKMTYKQAESAAAYGWIVSASNSRNDQLQSGHLYTRINLETARMGIAQHPLSQILEEYPAMKTLQNEFLELLQVPAGSTVQMLFRLGYAEPVPQTKRRYVSDLLS